MRLKARLPRDRWLPAEIVVVDGIPEAVIYGPVPCRGKADQALAELHGNPHRLTFKPFGDFPLGTYRLLKVQWNKRPPRSYGDAFIPLQGVSGDAYLAEDYGREGLGIHGGDPNSEGALRSTEGCLRLFNPDIHAIALLVEAQQAAGLLVELEAVETPSRSDGGYL